MSVPFGSIVASEIDKLVAVARGVFDYQFTATCKRDAFEANRAVADVEVPAVKMHIDAVEAAVFKAEVFVEVGAKNTPCNPAAFCCNVAEGAIEHPGAPNAIGARTEYSVFFFAIFLPGHCADIFQCDVVNTAEYVKAATGVHGDISFPFFQAHPLFADDGSAAFYGDAVVVIPPGSTASAVARKIKSAAFDDEVIVVAGYGGDVGEVFEFPGYIANDAAFFFDIEQFFAPPSRL